MFDNKKQQLKYLKWMDSTYEDYYNIDRNKQNSECARWS